jgi:indole-3-glycerol phosphate synthase
MTVASTPDLLKTIVAASRRIVEVRRQHVPETTLERQASARTRPADIFARALRDSAAPRVIAECKRRSPSKGILRQEYDAAGHAASYASAGAAAISVLTEPTFFDGSLDDLMRVRATVDVPLLRKDFIVTRYQILEAAACGADAVLLIVGALEPKDLATLLAAAREAALGALVEVHDEAELTIAVDAGADIIGVNSRNLRTLSVEPELHERLAVRIPRGAVAVAESGIRTHDDLVRLEGAGYHACLVGERLIAESDPGAALARLHRGPA